MGRYNYRSSPRPPILIAYISIRGTPGKHNSVVKALGHTDLSRFEELAHNVDLVKLGPKLPPPPLRGDL